MIREVHLFFSLTKEGAKDREKMNGTIFYKSPIEYLSSPQIILILLP